MSEHIKVEESYVDALINNAAWGAAKVKLDEAALSPAQKQLDTDGDGKIEGEDLAKLRKKKDKKEAMDPKKAEKQEESVEEHTCPLCESVLEEELSDERIYEHVNDILEAVQTLEEAAHDDDDKVEEEEEEEVEEAAMGDDDDTDEMAMNASKKKMKTEKVMKKVKELKKAAKKGK
mgnify:CR=1 FL=1